jgi:hypothetical protein
MALPVYNPEQLDTLARLMAEAALKQLARELSREVKSVELTEQSAPLADDSGAPPNDPGFEERT